MPLTKLLQPLRGTCRYCRQPAGLFRRTHRPCRDTYQSGMVNMIRLAKEAAHNPKFDEPALRQALQAIADLNYAGDNDIKKALEEGWRQEMDHAAQDGLISREEEERLRAFRDRLALWDESAGRKAIQALEDAAQDRLMMEARLAATYVRQDEQHLQELSASVSEAGLTRGESHLTCPNMELHPEERNKRNAQATTQEKRMV